MADILVVDDSSLDRAIAQQLLETESGYSIRFAENGRDAMEQIATEIPDLVLTDLQMPEMNGLQLVEAVRERIPSLPVILMTARGSEETALEAMRKGASAYVPKKSLAQHLAGTVSEILEAAENDRMHPRLMHAMECDECEFRLQNDPGLFEALAAHVQELLRCMQLGDESERLRVGRAIRHALEICHHHGNLEIFADPDLSDEDFASLASNRGCQSPWSDRSIVFRATVSRSALIVQIQYDGPRIDVSRISDSLETEAVERDWLNGFVILSAVLDDAEFDAEHSSLKLFKSPSMDADDEIEFSFSE